MEAQKSVKYCLACKNELSYLKLNDYVQCHHCHSFIYISDQSADEDNKRYFNEVFRTLDERKTSYWKLKIFEYFAQIDQRRRKKQYLGFNVHRQQIMDQLYRHAKVLEVGFGSGEHLNSLLQRGVDAYGLDLSVTAVENYQKKYPKYANKVHCGSRFGEQVDVIYCSALLEHLDKPEEFIQDASSCLNKNGLLIIDGLPVLNDSQSDLTLDEDINFWKPCHRAIYSSDGLNAMFSRYGFVNDICAAQDDYYYRILSLHKRYGYHSIEELRSFYIKHDKLPSILAYYFICWKALSIKSLARYKCIMFRKNIA